jgi:hypothetical protein
MKLILALTTLVLLQARPCYACKCAGPATVEESYKRADLIVYARVVRKDTVFLPETMQGDEVKKIREELEGNRKRLTLFERTPVARIELEVIDEFKGGYASGTVVVYTPLLSASCGFRFEVNTEYIIYASGMNFMSSFFRHPDHSYGSGKDNSFWTNHCTRTTAFRRSEAQELTGLKRKME